MHVLCVELIIAVRWTQYSDVVSFEMLVFVRYSYQMQDWDCKLLAEANAKKHMLPSFFPITYRYPIPRDWDTASKVCSDVQIATACFTSCIAFPLSLFFMFAVLQIIIQATD